MPPPFRRRTAKKEPRRSPRRTALEERIEEIMDRMHQAGDNQVERVAALEEYLTLARAHEGETWFDVGAWSEDLADSYLALGRVDDAVRTISDATRSGYDQRAGAGICAPVTRSRPLSSSARCARPACPRSSARPTKFSSERPRRTGGTQVRDKRSELAALSVAEKAAVLDELLAARPDLREPAEAFAAQIMSGADRSAVADDAGILLGLYNCRHGNSETLLEYCPDYAAERASGVVSDCARLGIELPTVELLDLVPEWSSLLH